jgi:hypothetical protein
MIEKDRVFLSYARADDHPDFKDPQKSLLRRLYNDLSNNGFDVWWDRESMPSRALSFLQEIRMAIDDADRFVLVIGPEALNSKYVRAEWEYALSICKPIVPILKHGNYDLIPQPLGGFHCVDFRNSQDYSSAFQELSRVLMDSIPSLANLIGVPSLPPNYLHRSGDINYLKQLVIVDLLDPTTIASSIQTTGLYGIAGIGKTVVASAFARDCDTRRAFHGGIVWLTLGQDKTPLAVLSSLETLLDATNSTEFTTEDQARLHLREILAEDNYLIIMDGMCQGSATTLLKRLRKILSDGRVNPHRIGRCLDDWLPAHKTLRMLSISSG